MRKLRSIFAAALCIVMLCVCAMAEGTEIRLNNVTLQLGDSVLDLSGIDLVVDCGDDQGANGFVFAVETAAGRILDVAATVEGSDLILTSSGLSKSYKINLADAAQAAGTASIGLDLGSLASGFGEEDLAKISELGMQAITMVQESIQDGGMIEYEGASYQKIDFALTEEQVQTLLLGGADFLDAHPEIGQAMGVDNFHSAIENAGIKLAIEGSIYLGDAGLMADVYLKSDANALLHFDYTTEENAETGETKILVEFYAGDQEGEEYPMDFEISGCITMKDGMPGCAEFFVGEPDDEGINIKVYLPEYQENGKIELIIETVDGSARFDVLVGAGEDGAVEIEIIATIDGAVIDIKANVSAAAAADGWLPAAKECVDILNMSEEDLALLQNEGISLLLGTLGQLGQANETVAALVGEIAG